ncbi:MAG: glycosyltransferase [Pacificimonas sp.]|jgi:predicted glycosyltransferase|nr:glycosyltransferase [Pacificimonas sp.]
MKPFAYFAHHQGRGHAHRAQAIIAELPANRPVTVLTADPSLFAGWEQRVDIVPLPNMIGAPSRTPALFAEPTPEVMHCVPLGVAEQRAHMAAIAQALDTLDPALFVVDVSAEITLLSRILSVPAVKIRMHGDRLDPGHLAAYECAAGLLAPFAEAIEQEDYPDWARAKTMYTGGLCTADTHVPKKAEAREALGLEPDRRIVVVLTGGGGSGTPYAPLTMAARAAPGTRFVTLGPVHREGHETDFANLEERGWVDDVGTWLSAADIVIASAGDNTVHEVAKIGRPFIVAPEWRYFDEQLRKAEQLERVGAAVLMRSWPGSLSAWRQVLAEAEAIDLSRQADLYDAGAAKRAADRLEDLAARLWSAE